ncbi:20590_t:CDS:2 [Gigaspora rosea]|nr:20590_t:CDS:2 [Gigaspora rosea]
MKRSSKGLYEINYDLPEACEQALHQIQVTQEKQKEQHDRPILLKPEFTIGDKVLLYNSRVMGTHRN